MSIAVKGPGADWSPAVETTQEAETASVVQDAATVAGDDADTGAGPADTGKPGALLPPCWGISPINPRVPVVSL